MFGVEDYFRMEGSYRFRYAEMQLPASLLNGVGFIATNLPGQPPNFDVDRRNWLKLPPTWRRRGSVFEINEVYWLSGPGGWPEPVYKNPSNAPFSDFSLRAGDVQGGSLGPASLP